MAMVQLLGYGVNELSLIPGGFAGWIDVCKEYKMIYWELDTSITLPYMPPVDQEKICKDMVNYLRVSW